MAQEQAGEGVTETKEKRIGTGLPGPGRPKGSKNKFSTTVKAAFEEAFEKLGGVEGLADWALENKTDFYKLYARLLPADVKVELPQLDRIRPTPDLQSARWIAMALEMAARQQQQTQH